MESNGTGMDSGAMVQVICCIFESIARRIIIIIMMESFRSACSMLKAWYVLCWYVIIIIGMIFYW